MSLQVPYREKQNGVQPSTKAVILVSSRPPLSDRIVPLAAALCAGEDGTGQ
ncbi:MAG: hypothetical protein OK454_11170 [Thaumarchaeota archaeon]|nr:hypothetical protein [Nitrososphaerota archaeon]